ncbi:MAG: phosphoribosylamine--glycine ligase N-terminal domain-containing protein, partial [Chitinophagales bacterium]
MNILVLGSGGREHALAWKLAQSTKTEQLFIAPGNAGTQNVGTNVDLDILNFEELAKFALKNEIKMLVVGPEAPLVEGVYDFFKAKEN